MNKRHEREEDIEDLTTKVKRDTVNDESILSDKWSDNLNNHITTKISESQFDTFIDWLFTLEKSTIINAVSYFETNVNLCSKMDIGKIIDQSTSQNIKIVAYQCITDFEFLKSVIYVHPK